MSKMKWWKVRYDDAVAKEAEAKQTPPKTFTQEELNSILAKEKRSFEERNQKLINDLKAIQESASMTAQEKQNLETQIEELQKVTMTKEELAQREQAKAKKLYEDNLKTLEAEATSWRSRYSRETIARAITDEAIIAGGFAPSQFVEILEKRSKLAPILGEDGKPTGNFITKVSFDDIDKDQKPVTLELTVPETIKRMKEIPDRFGNLFKSGANGGVGGSNNSSGYKPGAVVKDQKSWREQRESILN